MTMLKCTWRGCGRLTEQEPAVHVDPHYEATQDDRPDDGPFQPHTVDTSGYSQASHVGVASGEMMKKKIYNMIQVNTNKEIMPTTK